MIGKFLVKLGTWLEKHFPEKISTDEVYTKIAAIELRLHEVTELANNLDGLRALCAEHGEQLAALYKKAELLTSENSALKAAAALRTRVVSSIPMPGR